MTIWFVVADEARVLVQHASSAPAHWYRNLVQEPICQIDFGDGPLQARAHPIINDAKVQEVLRLIRRKYWLGRLIQLLGRKARPVAAEIEVVAQS